MFFIHNQPSNDEFLEWNIYSDMKSDFCSSYLAPYHDSTP